MMPQAGNVTSILCPVHRAGWPFIAIFFVVSLVLGWLWDPLFWLGMILTAWCAYFFRDPQRTTVQNPFIVSSPADGLVLHTHERRPPPELELGDEPLPCVGIFMNVFDVHINRAPVGGEILNRAYHAGKFLNAAMDKASDDNERQSFTFRTENGELVGLVQIAGLVARRIIAFEEVGKKVAAGDRVGLIRFGSKCDVYLPKGTIARVAVGQRAVAGETILARLDQHEEPLVARTQ